jgi:hypothetical protein
MGLRTTVGVTVTRRNLDELYQTIAAALLAGAGTLLLILGHNQSLMGVEDGCIG